MRFILIFLSLTLLYKANSQVVVTNNQTVQWYIQNVLAGPGVQISNVTYNAGAGNVVNEQVGSFTDASSSIGLPQGLILGSGDVQMASQPNTSSGSSLGGTFSMGVDPDLASITPNQIYDECIVEFDFIPVGDSITFSYVFASEEYPEYVCGSVNDAFGFFLSGPNPGGGNYTAQNLALIPDPNNPSVYTSTPVSINTVNPGVAGSSGSAANCNAIDPNWSQYSFFYAGNNTSTNYEYDGNTVVLTCRAAVICNETYHIKLAIGDGGDGAFDSGVFLEGGSFTSVGVSVDAGILNGATNLYEGCNAAYFAFSRPDTLEDLTVNFIWSGTAINGSDYFQVPDSIVLNEGAYTDTIFILPIVDNSTEPTETVELLILIETCNGNFDTISASLTIDDYTPISLSLPDSLNVCNELVNLNPNYSGGLPPLVFSWSSGQQTDSISFMPDLTQTYTLSINDECASQPSEASTEVWVQCPLLPPNVFTPNNDNENDIFKIQNLEDYEQSHIVIYNRWGKIVYENDNYQNDWNGTHYKSGNDIAPGVYFFIVQPNSYKYLYNENKDELLRNSISGYVHLMR